MKRFYCVILAMLAVVLYAIVMSGCRAISSNVEVATQPVVETSLAEHIGKVRQGPFVNDAEEFVRNISVLLEEKSPHDYSVRRIEEILLNNGYLEEYFKGNTEPLALYCFEYIINHESLCYVSDNQNVSFSGNDKAIALIAWELMLTYDDTDLNYICFSHSNYFTLSKDVPNGYDLVPNSAEVALSPYLIKTVSTESWYGFEQISTNMVQNIYYSQKEPMQILFDNYDDIFLYAESHDDKTKLKEKPHGQERLQA